jgi:hypothetical protein
LTAHLYAAGVGLWLAQSSDNTISHNDIHSFNYSGMSVGWNWNDAPTRTLRNTIEYNHLEGRGDALEVTDETAATGSRSVALVDAPNMQHVFNPHMFYTPHFRGGRATLGFDLRLKQGAVVAHEWRDGAQPCRVGPSIQIQRDGRLLANGKHLLDAPVGTWLHVEIVCGLGKQADGTYDLTVPGKPPSELNSLAFGSRQFTSLEWLGFVSLAAEKTVFYLDNVALSCSEAADP